MTPYVVALDLATTTGFARGYVGGTPEHGSVRFAKPGASDKAVFHACLRWAYNFLKTPPRADRLVIEALLPPTILKGGTNAGTLYRLAGLHAIVLAVAFEHGIHQVEIPSVGDIRAHFIGTRKCRRKQAKAEVTRKCLQLGWNPTDNNAADACAIWHWQCSRIDPRLAIQVSPLFSRSIAIEG